MCEYCESWHGLQATNSEELLQITIARPDAGDYLDYPPNGWSLRIYSDAAEGYYGEGGYIFYEINFCPMCGRKLN